MARKKNRVIPIQPSKVLLDYQKIYNNDVIHILRFVPGSNGKDEQFTLKCNCGKEYSAYLSDIEYARINKEYSDIRCDNCIDGNIQYYEDGVTLSPKIKEDIIEESVIEDQNDWKTNTSTNPWIQSFLKNFKSRNISKLQYFQLKFLGYAFIKDHYSIAINKNQKYNVVAQKRTTSTCFEIICPGCFKTFDMGYNLLRIRMSDSSRNPTTCATCKIQRSKKNPFEYKSRLQHNLENPNDIKKIFLDIPIYSLGHPDLKFRPRKDSVIHKLPNKIVGLSNIIKKNIAETRLIANICPGCNTETINNFGSVHSQIISKKRSDFVLCPICQSLYDFSENDKYFKKITAKITKWEPYYKSSTDFNFEFQEYYSWLFTIPSNVIDSILQDHSSSKSEEDMEFEFDDNIVVQAEVIPNQKEEKVIATLIEKDPIKPGVRLLLDNLEEKLNKEKEIIIEQVEIKSDEEKSNLEIISNRDSFFFQIVDDPRFKELVMEKTAAIVSVEFASRLIKE